MRVVELEQEDEDKEEQEKEEQNENEQDEEPEEQEQEEDPVADAYWVGDYVWRDSRKLARLRHYGHDDASCSLKCWTHKPPCERASSVRKLVLHAGKDYPRACVLWAIEGLEMSRDQHMTALDKLCGPRRQK